MYRFTFILFLLVAGGFYADAQYFIKVNADAAEYRENMDIIRQQHIKKRTDWRYVLIDGNVSTRKYIDKIVRYDEWGRMREIVVLNEKGIKSSIIVFEYNQGDLLLSEQEFFPNGERKGTTSYLYDTDGSLTEIVWYSGYDYILSKNFYFSDTVSGTVTEKSMYSPDSIKTRIIYFYTDLDNGTVYKELHYRGENQLEFKKLIRKDDDTGSTTEEEFYNPEGDLVYTLKYNYNPAGYLTSIDKVYTSGAKLKYYDCIYAEKGLLIGEVNYNSKGEITEYLKYNYE